MEPSEKNIEDKKSKVAVVEKIDEGSNDEPEEAKDGPGEAKEVQLPEIEVKVVDNLQKEG